jgi:hypothetical protein
MAHFKRPALAKKMVDNKMKDNAIKSSGFLLPPKATSDRYPPRGLATGNHTRIAYLIYIRQENPRQAILISLLDKMTISLFLFPEDFSAGSGGLY